MRSWNAARDAVDRSDGELLTTNAVVSPQGFRSGKKSRPVRISPQHSSQFSAVTPWIAATTGPSTRATVSRHGRRCRPCGYIHQSARPAPPMNATDPSTTSSSRCVRLLMRCSEYQRIAW
jgi:hypothetical protein